jgi:hypothetical protein
MGRQKIIEAMMALEVAVEIDDVLNALHAVVTSMAEYIAELEITLKVRRKQEAN